MAEKIKFKCVGCGRCCTIFKDEEVKTEGLPLKEWEVEKFKKLAKEKGVELDIRPADVLFDKRSGLYFCVDYKQLIEPCPFLDENNKCSIYDKRPLVCRAYPLVKNPIVFPRINLSHFGNCPTFDAKEFLIKNLEFKEGQENRVKRQFVSKEFLEAFGEEAFVSSLIISWHHSFVDETMKKIVQDKNFKLRKVSKMDLLRITPFSFFDFLIKKGYMDENLKEKMIKETLGYDQNKILTHSIIKGEFRNKKDTP